MRKFKNRLLVLLLANVFTIAAAAQTITGKVENSNSKESVAAVSITVKGSGEGTFTDNNGHFKLNVSKLPATLLVSSVGYETQEITVTDAGQPVAVSFKPSNVLGQEVVVSATRTSQKIMESPVSIERVSSAAIRNTPSAAYYDVISKIKGVDVVNSSLTFTSPTTRGFGGSGNTRFNQFVDGIDNQAPALNFSVASIVGLSELDVDNMELLPGASSALYGSGGMNGTLLINSKSPFQYQGLSAQVKLGAMHLGDDYRDVSPYYNAAVRWAQKTSDKFAYKITAEYIQAKDWLARDYRDYKRTGTNGSLVAGTKDTDPNYDGINVYGDETTIDLKSLVLNSIAAQVPFYADYVNSLSGPINVSRTGYTENELVSPNTFNYKVAAALHYKVSPRVEAILMGQLGGGNTIYTGSDRYSLKDFKISQYKLEFKSEKWFIRGYTTQEDAGESFNITATTRQFNEAWKPSTEWYQEYGFAYLNSKMAGQSDLAAHNIARATADQGRPQPGTAAFNALWDSIRLKPIYQNGGLFLDKSSLYVAEGQYNLSSMLNNVIEALVGGNWRLYHLNSENTLFHEDDGPININELGAYLQLGKEIIKDRLKLTASGRYDKNEFFKGKFTPRFTALIKPAADHNIRLSYQTAYRFPSTQQQWIDLVVGSGIIIGGNKKIWDSYNLTGNPAYSAPEYVASNGATKIVVPYAETKPESVSSFEAGYKALFAKKLLFDSYVYFGQYTNFIGRRDVVQLKDPADPSAGYQGYSIVSNADAKVKTFGWGASMEWRLPKNFSVNANVSSDELKDVPDNFRASFNAPKYRTSLGLSNSGFGPKGIFGFNVNWRWQDKITYESDFAVGNINAVHVVDAAFMIKQPAIKSVFKIGANNLFNQYYTNGLGNPSIGGLYYVSFAYNVF